jgi:hypothetical protein
VAHRSVELGGRPTGRCTRRAPPGRQTGRGRHAAAPAGERQVVRPREHGLRSLVAALIVLGALVSVGRCDQPDSPLRVLFLPVSCTVPVYDLIEGFVLVENHGSVPVQVPADLAIGHGYVLGMENTENNHTMIDIATSWPTSPDSIVTIPPGCAVATRSGFLPERRPGTLRLGVTLCLPADVKSGEPRQSIRSEWSMVTIVERK